MSTETETPPAEQTALVFHDLPGDDRDFKLDEVDRIQAEELLRKHTKVADALLQFNQATENYIGAFRSVVVEFRSAAIIGREAQICLARSGWAKSRISEAKRLIEADEKTFKAFAKAEIGVRLALEQARHSLPASTGREYKIPQLAKFFTDTVNGYNGPQPKKTIKLKTERLDCVFELVVKPTKAARSSKTAKGKK